MADMTSSTPPEQDATDTGAVDAQGQQQAPTDETPAAGNPAAAPDDAAPSTQTPAPAAAGQQGQPGQTAAQQGMSQKPGEGDPNDMKPDQPKPLDPAQAQAAAAVHPAVAKASIISDVAKALSGGPRFTTSIDPNTGVTSRTEVPVSGRQTAMAIAMIALGGSLTGLSQTGPNHEAKAAAAGYAQGQKQSDQIQQAQEQQAQQSSQDYARSAAITNTNFQTHANALKLGQMEYESHKQYVADAKPILDNLTAAGAVQATGVSESDVVSKYHVSKDMAIVDGTVPRRNPDGSQATNKDGSLAWDNTYSVIDPNKKIALPEATAKILSDHMIPGYFKMVDGKPQPIDMPANTQAAARIYVAGLATAQSIDLTEQGINSQLSGLSTNGGKDATQFAVDFKKALASGDLSQTAAKVMSQYATTPLDQLRATLQKDKIPPDTIGQIMSVIPKDAITQMTDAAAKKKTDASTAAKVAEQTALAPGKQAAAVSQAGAEAPGKVALAGNEAAARANAEIAVKKANGIPLTGGGAGSAVKDMIKDPNVAGIALSPDEQHLTDGVNTSYLNQVRTANPNLADLVQQIGSGQQMLSAYGLAKNDGQVLGSMVARAFPDYHFQKTEGFDKAYKSYTGGKDKDQIEAANTTYRHLSALYDASGHAALLPGTEAKADFDVTADKALEEIHSAYTPGVQHQEQYDRAAQGVKSPFPWVRQKAVADMANLLSDKSGEKQNSFRRAKPTSKIPDFDIISPDAAAAFQHVTGKSIGTNGYVAGSLSENPNQPQAGGKNQPPAMVPGQRQGETPVVVGGKTVGFTMPGKNGMRPNTPPQQ